ncbi:ADP-ribosylhydrolase ARH3-like [Clytia hemisphaerica]|uniref:ADP-ribosylhydrolase ARH3 n=1 Tax=Clytia hemisphaerica TaxID=252671 RepID=A0A7M5VBA1_9CNID|eukprot:TCONS_00068419-protein
MAKSNYKPCVDQFKGCLVGALIGDCLGAPFESNSFTGGISMQRITNLINPLKLESKREGSKRFTDDTAMSKSVSYSLIHCGKFDPVDMADRFTKSFFDERRGCAGGVRDGYGGAVREIFSLWARNGINIENVYKPSINQFEGKGSYGNGGAMRVASVALFSKSIEECVENARGSATLTHAHRNGYNGAILQCLAVYKALNTELICWRKFVHELIEEMRKIEDIENNDKLKLTKEEFLAEDDYEDFSEEEILSEWTRSESFSFTKQLRVIEELLTEHYENGKIDDIEHVIKLIGRDITAAQAVTAAVYCFLRTLNEPIENTLYYTISLGGDTDTIGTMCMAMVGAYRGSDQFPKSWIRVCESHQEIRTLGEKLYEQKNR